MRLILALPFFLMACVDGGSDKDDDPVDPVDTGDTGDTGETQPITDYDHDGYFSDVDCDDNNATVYPDAPELCDDIDNNCDDVIDEGWDADGDGYNTMVDCDIGTDCDDDDDDIHPDAEETPYDEIDQDCDGTDLSDVDGDGFDGEEAGGIDCDDSDSSVYPGADEVVKDGIDQDCDGSDDIDGDGDGYGDMDWGGDDCDDEDPEINPGATDFSNDDIDTNCDDDTDTIYELENADISVTSSLTAQALVGSSLQMCDLDEDGFDDLIIGAPFDNNYTGRVGIWYGLDHSEWTADMTIADADSVITGDTYGFLGFYVLCDDFNGDGHQDLVMQRGEINYASTYVTEWSLVFFYGDGSGFSSSLDEDDADAELIYELGVPVDIPSVYSTDASSADLDGDGAAELILTVGGDDMDIFGGEDRVVIVPGDDYSEDGDLSDRLSHIIAPSQPSQLYSAVAMPDMDGDGSSDIAVLSYGWSSNYDMASDDESPLAGEYSWEGRLDFIGGLPEPSEDHELDDLIWASHQATSEEGLYGFKAVDGDFDGDGSTDLVVSMAGETPSGSENGGGIFFFSDAASDLISDGTVDPDSAADATAYGDIQSFYVGYDMSNAGDINQDGYEDLLVSAPGLSYVASDGTLSYPTSSGWVYLVSGALLSGEISNLRDVSLLAWQGEDTSFDTGSELSAGGDIDGDGISDIVIGEQSWGTEATTGKAYIYLSTMY
jgi:hypothetical protein